MFCEHYDIWLRPDAPPLAKHRRNDEQSDLLRSDTPTQSTKVNRDARFETDQEDGQSGILTPSSASSTQKLLTLTFHTPPSFTAEPTDPASALVFPRNTS